jgi:elongation factor P hydroxylase
MDAKEMGLGIVKGTRKLTHPQSMFFPQDERSSFTPTHNRKCILNSITTSIATEEARQNWEGGTDGRVDLLDVGYLYCADGKDAQVTLLGQQCESVL